LSDDGFLPAATFSVRRETFSFAKMRLFARHLAADKNLFENLFDFHRAKVSKRSIPFVVKDVSR